MKLVNCLLFVAWAAITVCTLENAEGSEALGVLPDSAEAMGMVGGRLANLSDPSTARANPANMTKLTSREAQVNVGVWHGNLNFKPQNGKPSVDLMSGILPVGSAYFVNPISDDLVFGLGLGAPFGLSYDHQEFTALRYFAPHEAFLMAAAMSPSLAYKVNDQLSVGVGVDFVYSQLEMKQSFPWASVPGFAGTPDGEMHFESDGWGIGGFGGINWEFCPRQRLAFIGRLPIEVEYKGDFTVSGFPAPAAAGGFTPGSEFKSAIEYPGMLGVGYGIDVTDRLTLGIDYQYFFNSSHKSIPLEIGNNQALLGPNVRELTLNWKDNYDIGFGAKYKLNECFELRGGYMYSSNSVPDRTYTPSVPTNDRHIGSIGIGYEKGIHRLDFSYSAVKFPDRTVQGNQTAAFNGDYTYMWQIFNLSYGRKF